MNAEDADKSQGRASGDLLAIARLLGPHGLRGELRAVPLVPDVVDFPSLVSGNRPLYLRRGPDLLGPARVADLRPHGADLLLTLENYADRTQAESLKGAELCMARADLPDLPEGWFWEGDLVGLLVEDASRGPIGEARSLDTIAGRWVLTVLLARGGAIQIPWVKRLVLDVDLHSRKIKVDLPLDYPGLDD